MNTNLVDLITNKNIRNYVKTVLLFIANPKMLLRKNYVLCVIKKVSLLTEGNMSKILQLNRGRTVDDTG